MLDGNALDALDIDWVRRNITLVEQTSVLFDGTIFRNISYGRPDFDTVTLVDVQAAAQFALLTETVNDMPDGWETAVGAKGTAMSGGQRQRVALARARLRDAPVLILDESTSALDYINRTLVMDAIRAWRRGRTTIIITHDISQIQRDDYVYILESGKVVQDGYRKAIEKVKGSPFERFLAMTEEISVEMEAANSSSAAAAQMSPADDDDTSSSIYSTDSEEKENGVQDPLQKYLDTDIVGAPRFVPSMFVDQRVEPGNRHSMILPAAMGGHFFRVLPPPSATGAFSPALPSAMSPPQSMYIGFDDGGAGRRGSRSSKFYGYEGVFSNTHRKSISTRDYEIGLGIASSGESARRSRRRSEVIPLRERRYTGTTNSTPGVLEEEKDGPKASGKQSPLARLLSKLPIIGDKKEQPEKDDHTLLTFREILSDVWPRLTWRQRLLLVIGFGACVVHAISTPVFAYIFNKLLTTFYMRGPERRQRALVYSVSILGISVVDATANYLSHLLLEYVAQMWVHAVRQEAMARVLAQPREFFDAPENGVETLCESLDYYAEEMRNLVGRFTGAVLMAVLMMATAVVWSLASSWKLTLVGLSFAPVFYAITVAFNRVGGRQESLLNVADDAATGVLGETVVNIRTVRGLTLEAPQHRKYLAATRAIFTRGTKRALYCGLFFGLTDSVIFFATALLFYYGAVLVAAASSSTPQVLQVFTQLTISMTNVNVIIAMIPQAGSSRATATRLLRLATLPTTTHESTGTTRLPRVGDIAFHALSFAYPSRPTAPVITNLTTTIRAGTSVALVGPSGSGKSTLAALLLNLYPPPQPGMLTLSARDIHHLHTPTLRTRIALVSQSPTLFPASVHDNIAYGLRAPVPPAVVRAAARAAGIDDFILSLPHGFATLIGDGGGGSGLSGGQAQRIAIARALARRPDVLVLDEATSALDMESAGVVRESVRRLVREGGLTVVIITHAREMMEVAERVVVLEGGRVVEEGGFGELRGRRGGRFARLLGEGDGSEEVVEGVVEGKERRRRGRGSGRGVEGVEEYRRRSRAW